MDSNSTTTLDGSSDILALLDSSQTSLWPPFPSPSFHETMMNFDQHQPQPLSGKRLISSSLGPIRRGDEDEDGLDEIDISGLSPAEKKRRLSNEQVEFLEKSFEMENKLEPDRKMQLARDLGLQPRQVAVWFQNRRARYKTKQIEKDYVKLRTSYDELKADYDFLVKEKEGLQKELNLLTSQLKQRDMKEANLQQDIQHDPLYSNLVHDEVPKIDAKEMHKIEKIVAPSTTKQVEDASSAESDIVDSESPLCTEANTSSLMEDLVDQPANFSQNNEVSEDDQLIISTSLLFPPPPATPFTFTNLLKGDECYDPNGTSCDVPLIDGHPAWSWLD